MVLINVLGKWPSIKRECVFFGMLSCHKKLFKDYTFQMLNANYTLNIDCILLGQKNYLRNVDDSK